MATIHQLSSIKITDWDYLSGQWQIVSQSTSDNSSVIKWWFYLNSTSSGQIDSSVSKTWSAVVNGTSYSGTNTIAIGNNQTLRLAEGTTTIYHRSSGSTNFSLSFTQQFDINFDGVYIGKKTLSDYGTLDQMNRASTISVGDGTLGVAQTITIIQQDPLLEHGLTYSCGSVKTQLICPWNTTETSVSFTPPLDLAWEAVNGDRVWVEIHLQTYTHYGFTVGDTVTKGVWMTIPESIKPSCTVKVSDPTGYADKYGGYIQGQSKLSIDVTPRTSYGSAITGYTVTADGSNYATGNVVTPVIQGTGTLTVNASVTDTRGRTGSASANVTVLPYTRPSVTTLKVHRCNQDGTENDQGQFCKVTYGYTVDTLNGKNGMSAFIQYKKSTDSAYITHELPTAFTVTNNTFIFAADDESTYDVQVLVADNFVSVGLNTKLSTAYTLIHFSSSGKGISFGGINDDDGFNIMGMPFKINNIDVDYIVEQGEVNGWFYRKWNSGFAECWKVYYGYGITSAKNNYSGFFYSETITVPFPFTFINLPTVTVDGGSVNYMNFVRVFGKYSDKASFSVVSMMDAGTIDVTVDIKAIGRWK